MDTDPLKYILIRNRRAIEIEKIGVDELLRRLGISQWMIDDMTDVEKRHLAGKICRDIISSEVE